MNNSLLQSELDWIDKNIDRYDSYLHAQAVKQNIIKRYYIKELEDKVNNT